jgi:Ca2+-binding EF-hand superfamily protein
MKKNKLVLTTLLVTGVILTTGCAGKFGNGNAENKFFKRFDKNSDGYLSKKEYLDTKLERFDRTDDNDDGKITMAEMKESRFSKIVPSFIDRFFETNDLNNDSMVSKAEIIEVTKNDFMKTDKNKDNKLSLEEIKKFKAEQRFESIDKNNDGVISKDEYKNQKSPFDKVRG